MAREGGGVVPTGLPWPVPALGGTIGWPSTPAASHRRPHAAASQEAGESGGGVWRARAAAATMAPTHEGHPPGTRPGHRGHGRPSLLTLTWLLPRPL